MTPFVEGLALGASLIIAIGAQNAFVIQQGILREHVFLVASVCTLVDAVLISLGAAGIGSLIATNETLRFMALWGGILFLLGYATVSLVSSFRNMPDSKDASLNEGGRAFPLDSRKTAAATAASLSLLNPHVYLDTVVLLGGIAAQYEGTGRIYFTVGAIAASVIWFYGIGYGATRVAPWFGSSKGKRILNRIIAFIMFLLAGMMMFNA
jgi:L-lysine exporter family protein LysE/ArgO